jgi:hypothetical protein
MRSKRHITFYHPTTTTTTIYIQIHQYSNNHKYKYMYVWLVYVRIGIYVYSLLLNSDRMHYLYQKDECALPGNLQNRQYSLLPPPPPNVVSHYLPTSSLFSLLLMFQSLNGYMKEKILCCVNS